MRVVAGVAGRTKLVAPKGMDTRPTSDMAKENLFNILAPHVRGARFLDLFCGSGAIGIEALSRGADEAVFVENAKPAIDATQQNLEKTKLKADVLAFPVQRAIDLLESEKRCFDIIFLDPPYETDLLIQTLKHLSKTHLLAANGLLIAETDSNFGDIVGVPREFALVDKRNYGRTCFLFYRWAVTAA